MLRVGIIGLPNAGKSTLYNSLSASHHAMIANYPFSTIEPNIGIITIPDKRLDNLTQIYKPPKSVRSNLEIFDIAGLVKGASKGEGLGNQFLSHIREVDAIIHIVRCFENEKVSHVAGQMNPKSDIETVETELILKDIETLDNKIQKTHKLLKTGEKKIKEEYDFYIELKSQLGSGNLAKHFTGFSRVLKSLNLLTDKHIIYVANVDDKHLSGNEYTKVVENIAGQEKEETVVLSAEVESELTRLNQNEQKEFKEMLGIKESGLDRLIYSVYKLLGLITFYTVNEKEIHAWAIPLGTKAPQAAGTIHSDFEKGFIKAEVTKYEDIIRLGSQNAVKEHGLLHIEGKDYEVKDGDIIYFRFHL